MTECPVCDRKVDNLSSGIKNGVYISERCDRCMANNKQFADYARKYNRDRGREDYRKDIIQGYEGDKVNPEFIKAYPKEAEERWGKDVLRDHGINRKQY